VTACLAVNDGHGFSMTFANGVTVSVQFGAGNYCGNYPSGIAGQEKPHGRHSSPDAEIAILGPKPTDPVTRRPWLTKDFDPAHGDDVKGWVGPAGVLLALIWAEAWKPGQSAPDSLAPALSVSVPEQSNQAGTP